MKIFASDIPIRFLEETDLEPLKSYDKVLKGVQNLDDFDFEKKILVGGLSVGDVVELIAHITTSKPKKVERMDVVGIEFGDMLSAIEARFEIISAAGGVVEKGDEFLLIHRLGKWDLPKGKQEAGESVKLCATREVEEETGVRASILEPLPDVWHTYKLNDQLILKCTFWFHMECISDENLVPQSEEGITDIKWLGMKDAKNALDTSYNSLKGLFADFMVHRSRT